VNVATVSKGGGRMIAMHCLSRDDGVGWSRRGEHNGEGRIYGERADGTGRREGIACAALYQVSHVFGHVIGER